LLKKIILKSIVQISGISNGIGSLTRCGNYGIDRKYTANSISVYFTGIYFANF